MSPLFDVVPEPESGELMININETERRDVLPLYGKSYGIDRLKVER